MNPESHYSTLITSAELLQGPRSKRCYGSVITRFFLWITRRHFHFEWTWSHDPMCHVRWCVKCGLKSVSVTLSQYGDSDGNLRWRKNILTISKIGFEVWVSPFTVFIAISQFYAMGRVMEVQLVIDIDLISDSGISDASSDPQSRSCAATRQSNSGLRSFLSKFIQWIVSLSHSPAWRPSRRPRTPPCFTHVRAFPVQTCVFVGGWNVLWSSPPTLSPPPPPADSLSLALTPRSWTLGWTLRTWTLQSACPQANGTKRTRTWLHSKTLVGSNVGPSRWGRPGKRKKNPDWKSGQAPRGRFPAVCPLSVHCLSAAKSLHRRRTTWAGCSQNRPKQ